MTPRDKALDARLAEAQALVGKVPPLTWLVPLLVDLPDILALARDGLILHETLKDLQAYTTTIQEATTRLRELEARIEAIKGATGRLKADWDAPSEFDVGDFDRRVDALVAAVG